VLLRREVRWAFAAGHGSGAQPARTTQSTRAFGIIATRPAQRLPETSDGSRYNDACRCLSYRRLLDETRAPSRATAIQFDIPLRNASRHGRPGSAAASRNGRVAAMASPFTRDTAMNDTPADSPPKHDSPAPASQVPEYMRRIRSFVLREGRMTPAQQRAFDEHWSRYGVDYHAAVHDFDVSFKRSAPRVLEIGFGNGEALAWASENDQARDFIGVEVHGPGVGRVMNALAARNANNVRLYKHDAVEVLEHEIAPASLAEVRIWFPDPWHKKRHNKRRLIQPEFAALLASRMAPNGLLHLATDWQAYAEHMREVMEAAPGWRNPLAPGAFADKPDWRIETHFERRGLKLGHGVWDLLYRKL